MTACVNNSKPQWLVSGKCLGCLYFTLCLLLFTASTASAQFGTRADGNGGLTITGYSGTDSAIVIPSTIDGLPVTGIATYAFTDFSSSTTPLRSITIPSSVTTIDDYAFYFCDLTSVNIPDSVTYLGHMAFAYSDSLISVTIASGLTSIGDYAFYQCVSLTSVTIRPGVASIEDFAFSGCLSLTDLTLPDSLATIGQYAFGGVALSAVAIPNSVISIGPSAFYSSRNLSSVTIGTGTTSIGTAAFDYCPELMAIAVDQSNTVYSSSSGVLFDKAQHTLVQFPCGQPGSYTVPTSVTDIGEDAFAYANNLSGLTLPNGLITIEANAFQGCGDLKTVAIPDYATSIGDYAFDQSGLKTVTIGSRVVTIGARAFSCPLQSITIPNSVTTIGGYAFDGCSITSVTIPDSVTSLGEGAFQGCSSLSTATIGLGITTIAASTFYQCGLTNLNLGGNVASIGQDAFAYCTSLRSVEIPSNVTSLGDYAFSSCTNLTNAYFDGNAPTLGTEVFIPAASGFKVAYSNEATGFTTPTWAYNVENSYPAIPYYAITTSDGKVAITGYNGPGGTIDLSTINGLPVVSIAGFQAVANLISVQLPATVTSIATGAFEECPALTSINVDPSNPDFSSANGVLYDKAQSTLMLYPGGKTGAFTVPIGVITIEDVAFAFCPGLTRVSLPAGVTSIGNGSFGGCRGITSVTIPSTVVSIGEEAFAACNNLESATFLGNAPSMGMYAFAFDSSAFIVYYASGAAGFTSPTWTDSSGDVYPTSVITSLCVQSFSDWQSHYGITTSMLATPLNDGVPNLLKYLYDIDPTVPMSETSQAALPTVGVDSITIPNATYLTLTYRKYAMATGVTIGVQVSSDLRTWTLLDSTQYTSQQETSEVGSSGQSDAVTRISVNATGATNKFIRLHLTSP